MVQLDDVDDGAGDAEDDEHEDDHEQHPEISRIRIALILSRMSKIRLEEKTFDKLKPIYKKFWSKIKNSLLQARPVQYTEENSVQL